MSRGIGYLQRDVIEIAREHRGFVAFDVLAELRPREAQTHSLHRSVRGLRKREMVREIQWDGRRFLFLTFGKTKKPTRQDRELIGLCETIQRQLLLIAQARGVAIPEEAGVLRESLVAYREEVGISG